MKKLLLLILPLTGCGIKANPEVLKAPEVDIRRIGQKVYVKSLSGDIRIKGFERYEDYWIKEEEKPFCFVVQRLGERSQKFCVGPALEERPTLKLVENDSYVKVLPSGFESYRLYSLRDGFVYLESAKTFSKEIQIERDYWERCYAITGLKGNTESQSVELCIKPKPPPSIPEVEGLELRRGRRTLYIVWFYQHQYKEFVIYKDGKEIARTTGFAFETELPQNKTTFTVRVISPLGFESKGLSIDYSP